LIHIDKENKMKITRSTGYALLAVGYIAKHQDEKIILSQTISKAYDIPLEYLLKILQQLVKANVLRSKRGPRGGFSLAKAPTKITMLAVLEAVDGPMEGQFSLAEYTKRDKFGGKADKAYEKALNQAKVIFSRTRISDLLK